MAVQSNYSETMFSFFKKKSAPSAEPTPAQIVPVYHWSDEEIPRYPPFMKGLPVISPDRLLETQSEIIQRIKNTAIATPEVFGAHYLPAIRRFASFVHLLPASQAHHHRGAGGLLRHALEVGLWALQAADKIMLKNALSPAHRREMEPRWQLAVFLAAMCHDAGKPVTDLHITNMDRSKVWNPLVEDLHVWAQRNDLTAYYIDWREGRGRQHTALSSLVGERIIGMPSMAWIGEGETELVAWVMESLSNNPSPNNLIHDLVIRADQASVERDMKTLGVAMAGYDIGVPVERHLTEVMRRLVRESVWLVNEPGARVWNIGGMIFLVWPGAGEELAKEVRREGLPGLPRTPDGLLDMLVDRHLASMREGKGGPDYWQIAPAVLVEKIPDLRLKAIRLRDDTMLSPIPLPQAAGRVIDPDAPVSAEEGAAKEAPSEAGSSEMPAATETNEAIATPAPPPTQDATESAPAAPAEAKSATSKAKAERKPKSGSSALPKPAITATPAVEQEPLENVAAPAAEEEKPVIFDGRIGEALKGLAEDVREGVEKKWGRDVLHLKDGSVQLRWPDALHGCGLQQKVILDDLTSRNWLVTDAFANHAKTVKARFEESADLVPALQLIPSVGRAFAELASKGEIPAQAKSESKKPKPKNKTEKPDRQGITQPAPQASSAPAQVNEPTDPAAVVAVIEEPAKEDGDLPAYPIEDVIEALKTLSPTVKGNWCIVKRTAALDALAQRNMPVAGFPGLRAICKGHEDRLQVVGNDLKYRP